MQSDAALDRAVRGVREHGLDGPVERWERLRDRIRTDVEAHGYDPGRNTFVQSYGSTALDASLLQLPQVGFCAPDDPRMLGTVAAIEEDLLRDGLVMRYRFEDAHVDKLPPGEHPFLACSFWLVSAYAAAGRLEDAHALFDRVVELQNDVGLLSEEYDPHAKRLIGNFPQGFSHIGLVNTAFNLVQAHGPAQQRSERLAPTGKDARSAANAGRNLRPTGKDAGSAANAAPHLRSAT